MSSALPSRGFSALDYTAWFLEQNDVTAYRGSDLVSNDIMERSSIFTEWVQPMGIRYMGGVIMHVNGVRVAGIVLLRSEDGGDFTDRVLFLLTLIARQIELWLTLAWPATESIDVPNRVVADLSILTDREIEVARLAFADRAHRARGGAPYGVLTRCLNH